MKSVAVRLFATLMVLVAINSALGCGREGHPECARPRARQADRPLHDGREGEDQPLWLTHPQRGLARRASFADSVRAQYGQVLLVDNGGFFPEQDDYEDAAWFLMTP